MQNGLKIFIFLTFSLSPTLCSGGDSSPFYLRCMDKCKTANCSEDGLTFIEDKQSIILKVTMWSCADECSYECMWKTVEFFETKALRVPQFHGKWPFIRMMGMQEPASVVFSLLNFLVHWTMLKRFRKQVRPDSPLFWLWHLFALVCLNAWIWSAIFHMRDFPVTELMDYACAFSIVMINCYCMVIRLLKDVPRFVLVTLTVFFIISYFKHVMYLSQGRFDYGYNMQVNILVGTFTAICWFGWCTWNRIRQPYVWKCAAYVSLMGVAMLLEVVDVPPLLWMFDFHSLWHLATAPLAWLFYRFVIDDCKYLRKRMFFDEEEPYKSS